MENTIKSKQQKIKKLDFRNIYFVRLADFSSLLLFKSKDEKYYSFKDFKVYNGENYIKPLSIDNNYYDSDEPINYPPKFNFDSEGIFIKPILKKFVKHSSLSGKDILKLQKGNDKYAKRMLKLNEKARRKFEKINKSNSAMEDIIEKE